MYRFLLVFSVPFDFIVLLLFYSLIASSNRVPSSGGKQLVFMMKGMNSMNLKYMTF